MANQGYTAADMADQYATAFERGRESVFAERTAAAQEAVAYLDIGAGGYLDIGSDLPEEQLLALPNGRHALGIIGTFGIDGYVAAPVTAAPGIDLEQFRKLSRDMRKFIDNWDTISIDEFAHFSMRLDEMIDASPKVATFHNDGNSEAQFITDEARLNCPSCGGSGHVEDSPKGGSEARDGERYRWLRERWGRISETYDADTPIMTEIGDDTEGWITDGDSLDRCIDAAMQASDAEVPNG